MIAVPWACVGFPFSRVVYHPGLEKVVTRHTFKHYHGGLGEECTIAFAAVLSWCRRVVGLDTRPKKGDEGERGLEEATR